MSAPGAPLNFLEFFAGAGMARAGLGPEWTCLLANDSDAKKAASYRANFGAGELKVCDIADLTPSDIRGGIVLAWASPPCQDISLAGDRAGLAGSRSSAFWPFMRLMQGLRAQGRAPKMIVIENVAGLRSSRDGRDFEAICGALADAGYRWAQWRSTLHCSCRSQGPAYSLSPPPPPPPFTFPLTCL